MGVERRRVGLREQKAGVHYEQQLEHRGVIMGRLLRLVDHVWDFLHSQQHLNPPTC